LKANLKELQVLNILNPDIANEQVNMLFNST
jgi:hypothetical protein